MSGSDLAVEPGADKKAEKDLQPVTDQVGTVADQVQTMSAAQTEAKWGVERGPDFFSRIYRSVLDTANTDIVALQAELNAYLTTVTTVVAEFTEKDTDSATAQKILDGRADHESGADAANGNPNNTGTPSNTGAPGPTGNSLLNGNSTTFNAPGVSLMQGLTGGEKVCTATPPYTFPTIPKS